MMLFAGGAGAGAQTSPTAGQDISGLSLSLSLSLCVCVCVCVCVYSPSPSLSISLSLSLSVRVYRLISGFSLPVSTLNYLGSFCSLSFPHLQEALAALNKEAAAPLVKNLVQDIKDAHDHEADLSLPFIPAHVTEWYCTGGACLSRRGGGLRRRKLGAIR